MISAWGHLSAHRTGGGQVGEALVEQWNHGC